MRRSFSITKRKKKKPPTPLELKSTVKLLRRAMLEFTVQDSETFF
ncbi:hypothetical protein Lalb_Chr11g0063781 [Lupinus albus]|uniref:Uncharacterized protein n=1 Tax=Lupinus albus TaxID=3870 RepID=A0A6A4PQQ5_LUPAL|nr:hypothetical protein Lalb_Chr11g0063781 [Lupinus albus]